MRVDNASMLVSAIGESKFQIVVPNADNLFSNQEEQEIDTILRTVDARFFTISENMAPQASIFDFVQILLQCPFVQTILTSAGYDILKYALTKIVNAIFKSHPVILRTSHTGKPNLEKSGVQINIPTDKGEIKLLIPQDIDSETMGEYLKQVINVVSEKPLGEPAKEVNNTPLVYRVISKNNQGEFIVQSESEFFQYLMNQSNMDNTNSHTRELHSDSEN